MIRDVTIPPLFSLIDKGKNLLLLKDEYKDLLLRLGIDDVEAFVRRNQEDARSLQGRTAHPSIPLKEGERIVVRRYSHGGFFRLLTKDLFVSGHRSFRELALTEEVRSCGIPTVQPVGAIHQPVFLLVYRAWLLSFEVPQAINLVDYLRKTDPSSGKGVSYKRRLLRSAGLLIRQFHDAGFFHRDLQLKNILVAADQVLLIDFDRSYRATRLSMRERMRNLLRLNRSVEKWRRRGLPITRTDRWRFFLTYAGNDRAIRQAMRRSLRFHSVGTFFHRVYWTMGRSWFKASRASERS